MNDHARCGGIDEYGRHYKGGQFLPFYVPRPAMPQVEASQYQFLVLDALDSGNGCELDVVAVSGLRAHQRINHGRAMAMPTRGKMQPVIASSDGYVLDGNHRWWAHVHDGDQYINVIRLNLPFAAAIDWLLALPYVTTGERL